MSDDLKFGVFLGFGLVALPTLVWALSSATSAIVGVGRELQEVAEELRQLRAKYGDDER